MAMVTVRAVRR